MADQFVGEIRIFAGNFAPTGWALCNGQLMPIAQNTALFSLLGTFYGGDGRTTFALPNLQGAAPLMAGQGNGLSLRDLGETGGAAAVTLLTSELPSHPHAVMGTSSPGSVPDPANDVWGVAAVARGTTMYSSSPGGTPSQMNAQSFSPSGGSLPHNNMPPYLVLTFIIALQGVYPPRS
jgi:microcystin-dependent protein